MALPRLLSLKTEKSFEVALDNAAGIAGIALPHAVASNDIPTRKLSDQTREWLIRWLLHTFKTLKNSHERLDVKAWRLLSVLLQGGQVSGVARLLVEHSFITTLETTLKDYCEELLKDRPVAVITPTSKKRKRGSESPTSDAPLTVKEPEKSLLSAIDTCVQVLVRLTQDAELRGRLVEKEHIASTLRTDVEQACRILGLWLKAIFTGRTLNSTCSSSIESPLAILHSSLSATRLEGEQVANWLSQYCLVEALEVLHGLQTHEIQTSEKPRPPDSEGDEANTPTQLERHLRQTLATHLVHHLFQRYQKSTRVGDSRAEDQDATVSRLLRIHNDSTAELQAKSHRQTMILMPVLWKLLVISVPRSGRKQEMAVLSWLGAMFDALVRQNDIAGSVDEGAPRENLPAGVLERMLNVCVQEHVTISSNTLSAIAQRHLDTALVQPGKQHRPLLARLLELDPSIFLPRRRLQDLDNTSTDAPTLDEHIIRTIGVVPWCDEYDAVTAAHLLSIAKSKSGQEPQEEILRRHGIRAADFREQFPIPLLRAYGSDRSMHQFLARWREALNSRGAYEDDSQGATTVWEDHALSSAMQPLIRSSLSNQQLLDEISTASQPLLELLQSFASHHSVQSMGDAALVELGTSLRVLEVLLGSVGEDNVAQTHQEALEPLLVAILQVEVPLKFFPKHILRKIWQMLSQAVRIMQSGQSNEERIRISLQVLRSVFYEEALDTLSDEKVLTTSQKVDELGDALLIVFRVSQALLMDNAYKEITQPTSRAIEEAIRQGRSVTDANTSPGDDRGLLMCIGSLSIASHIARSNWILGHIDGKCRSDLFRSVIVAAATLRSRRAGNEFDETSQHFTSVLTALFDAVSRDCGDAVRHELNEASACFIVNLDEALNNDQSSLEGQLALSLLMRMQPSNIARQTRERLLDSVCTILTGSAGLDLGLGLVGTFIAFASRLMSVSNGKAKLCNEFDILFGIGKVVDRYRDLDLLRIFRGLVNKVCRSLSDEEKQSRFSGHYIRIYQDKFINHGTGPSPAETVILNKAILKLPQKSSICKSLYAWATGILAAEQHDSSMAGRLDPLPNELQRFPCQEMVSIFAPFLTTSQVTKNLPVSGGPPLETHMKTRNGVVGGSEAVSKPSLDATSEVAARAMKDDLAQQSLQLAKAATLKDFGMATDLIDTGLTGGRLASQLGVDSLLSGLITVTSRKCALHDRNHAGQVLMRLCSLMGTLIALHRVRLRGRYHLLVRLLCNLLVCFSVPHAYSSRAKSLDHPGWLGSKASALTPRHASAFARLLTSLASPTVSSLHRRAHSGLRDEVKEAKAHLGRFVPCLVAVYCRLTLNGKFAPEIRRRIVPAMWTAMQTVDKEAWRAMSASMDADGRAIWNQFYAEWKRAGAR